MMDEYCTQELVKRREELKIDLNRTIGERNSALEELARVTEERDSLQAKLDEAVDKALALAKERDALREKLAKFKPTVEDKLREFAWAWESTYEDSDEEAEVYAKFAAMFELKEGAE